MVGPTQVDELLLLSSLPRNQGIGRGAWHLEVLCVCGDSGGGAGARGRTGADRSFPLSRGCPIT